MKTRVLTGVAAGAFLLAIIFWATDGLLLTACLLSATICCMEYDKLMFTDRKLFRQIRMVAATLMTILAMRHDFLVAWTFFWLIFALHCTWHISQAKHIKNLRLTLTQLMEEFFGYIYVVGLFGFLTPIAEVKPWGRDLILLLFMIVALGDVAALFVGRRFGKSTLADKVSPNKTVEGSMGAVAMSVAISYVWLKWIYRGEANENYYVAVLVFAVFCSFLAQLGDLFESVLKRANDKKDSGAFLPGHGGLLDRTDGLVFAAPVFYFYVVYVLDRLQ